MSKNSKKAASQTAAEEASSTEEIAIRGVEINRTLKIAGDHHRAGTIFTDLSPEQADEIVSAGYGRYIDVGVPLDAIVAESGDPIAPEGEETVGNENPTEQDSTETAETA